MSSNVEFAINLVKGKIAETIFAQMYRETKKFTVLEFGYEKIIPELVQQGYEEENQMIKTLRTAPDFAVIDQTKRHVRLVEVKYRHTIDAAIVLRDAKRMQASWNPSYLFIATLDGFYFGEIGSIVKNYGTILPLSEDEIPSRVQKQYLKILCEYEDKSFIKTAFTKARTVV